MTGIATAKSIEDEKITEPNIPVAIDLRLARAGYDAYARATPQTFDGWSKPSFDLLEQRIKQAWSAAAAAILVEHSKEPAP